MLYELIYSSNPVEPLGSAEIEALLEQARGRNRALNLTGILFYDDREFLQLIEGEQDAVEQVFASIKQDPRHCNITVFHTGTVAVRSFSTWLMAFERVAPETALEQWRDHVVGTAGDLLQGAPNLGYRLLELLRDEDVRRAAG